MVWAAGVDQGARNPEDLVVDVKATFSSLTFSCHDAIPCTGDCETGQGGKRATRSPGSGGGGQRPAIRMRLTMNKVFCRVQNFRASELKPSLRKERRPRQ
eukprot:TRINITY_DN60137_c0_g1_i1.p2 TRINITY_DN60137_c0_g1~~TRINITY_DN60137_c0_g1_i1.p2  ORF type:complete len:100 (+),score=6.34 TRINITY_DN60137_c0_g1_i1:265-564(+)